MIATLVASSYIQRSCHCFSSIFVAGPLRGHKCCFNLTEMRECEWNGGVPLGLLRLQDED
jgi:hypothetical protein